MYIYIYILFRYILHIIYIYIIIYTYISSYICSSIDRCHIKTQLSKKIEAHSAHPKFLAPKSCWRWYRWSTRTCLSTETTTTSLVFFHTETIRNVCCLTAIFGRLLWRRSSSTPQMQCSNLTKPWCPRYQRGTEHCIASAEMIWVAFFPGAWQLHPQASSLSAWPSACFLSLALSLHPTLPGKKSWSYDYEQLWFLGTSPDIIRCVTVEESDREMPKLCTNDLMDLTSLSCRLWPKLEATDIKYLYVYKNGSNSSILNTKVALGRSKMKWTILVKFTAWPV